MHENFDRKMDNEGKNNISNTTADGQSQILVSDGEKFENENTFKNVFESTIFTGNNIYFLAFASFAMIITAIVTLIRHRQQKHAAEQKELDYLRYFHSILPHSQIYGNLNEKFSKLDKRSNSKKNKRKRTDKVEDMSDVDVKLNGLTSIYKKFRYSQYTARTISKESSYDNDDSKSFDETELMNIEITPATVVEIHENGQVPADSDIPATRTVCQKYRFAVKPDDMIENTKTDETDKEMVRRHLFGGKFLEKVVQKSKTESSNHRVHFRLESDEKIQDNTQNAISPQSQHVAVIENNSSENNDKGLKKLLLEEMNDMQVTAL